MLIVSLAVRDSLVASYLAQDCPIVGEHLQVQQRGLTLTFTAWEECSSDCDTGLAFRAAFCQDPFSNLADLAGCPAYNGEQQCV